MAGSTIARTAHFALHCVSLSAHAPANGLATHPVPAKAQNKSTAMQARPLFDVCDVWMGAMVPKRWAKRAVTRNAIKRQIYNAGDLAEPSLARAAHVVRLRSGFDTVYPSATSDALKTAVRMELAQLFIAAAKAVKEAMAGKAGKASAGDAGPAADIAQGVTIGVMRGAKTQARSKP